MLKILVVAIWVVPEVAFVPEEEEVEVVLWMDVTGCVVVEAVVTAKFVH